MTGVNWGLVAVSFVLGLVLTLAFVIGRAKREVPVYATGGAKAATLTGSAATAKKGVGDAPTAVIAAPAAEAETAVIAVPDNDTDTDTDTETAVIAVPHTDTDTETETAVIAVPDADADADLPTTTIATGAAGGAVAAGLLSGTGDDDADAPYGAGSVRLTAGAAPPSGWDIKGNEDSMLYHTVDSPSYRQTIAELWFRDEDTARGAGFRHWKEGRKATAATFAATEPELPPGPHGPGSATPAADGSGPEGWTVKGNEDSMLYHSTESSAYAVTVAEVWFRDVETAEAAGFNRWDSGKSQRGKK